MDAPPVRVRDVVLAAAFLLGPFLLIGLVMRWSNLAVVLLLTLLFDAPLIALGTFLRRRKARRGT